MTTSRADSHDLDKLERWYGGLCADEAVRFPAHAIFLVSADDKAAHNIFRDYRSGFEAHDAMFRHLVIFGQHGVSGTARRLLAEFGLHPESTPTLVLYPEPSAGTAYVLPLPGGNGDESNHLWVEVLAKIESAAEAGEESLDLEDLEDPEAMTGLTKRRLACGSLAELVSGALESLKNPHS
jgi:hypothetical protein